MVHHVDYANSWWQICAPFGLTLLAVGFNIGNMPNLQRLYRVLMIIGGTLLILGSSFETYLAEHLTGRVMGIAFLTLNFIFTLNEFKEMLRLKRAAK